MLRVSGMAMTILMLTTFTMTMMQQTHAQNLPCYFSGQNFTTGDISATGSKGTYYLNLCTALATGSGNCPGNTAICQARQGEQSQTLGTIGSGLWSADGVVLYAMQYETCTNGSVSAPRVSIAEFQCNANAANPTMTVDDVSFIKLWGDGPYECTWVFTIQSQQACNVSTGSGGKSLSGGWIFIIILIVVTALYVFGGIAYMKFRKGASGTDLCPNKEFWKDLPGLVKDGFAFVFSKCRGGAKGGDTYNNI